MNREEQFKSIIFQMLKPLKNIPLDIIIESICGHKILKYDSRALEVIEKITKECGLLINRKGVQSRRVNEVGNYLEKYLVEAIRNCDQEADTPITQSGKKKSTGYPDIEATIDKKPFYIEVKSYNFLNRDTTQRSFYLSPSSDFKITHDAYHLIFAFEILKKRTKYYASSCTILDAKNLLCDVKYEFNSDNKRMYHESSDLEILKVDFKKEE